MNYVNQAFIKVFRGHEAASAETDKPQTEPAEVPPATKVQQSQGTCVVGLWTGEGESAGDGPDGQTGADGNAESPQSDPVRSGSHLPAVLAAAAAAGEPDLSEYHGRGAGVEYLRPFVPLPPRRRSGGAAPTGRTEFPFSPAQAPPAPRARVIIVNEPAHAVPAPHFQIPAAAQAAGDAPQSVETPENVPERPLSVPQQESAPQQQVAPQQQSVPQQSAPQQNVPEQTTPQQTTPSPQQQNVAPETPRAATGDAETREAPFRPAWEVDNFEWPAAIGQVFAERPDSFDALAEQIVQLADTGSKRIAVIGSCPGAGGTTLALCLARRLSQVVQEVALVDANLGNPQLATDLDVRLDAGWEDVLNGRQIPEEVAVTAVENGITLLPLLSSELKADAATVTDRVAEVQRRLAANHDVVLVDAGPIWGEGVELIASGEAEAAVDAAVLVRDVRQTADRELKVAVAELASRGVPVVAIAENYQESTVAEDVRQAA